MKLGEDGAHHLATVAADFIDLLRGDYGDEAGLSGFVLIAEVTEPNGEEDVTTVRWEHDVSWAHAGGMAQAAADGLVRSGNRDE